MDEDKMGVQWVGLCWPESKTLILAKQSDQ